MFSGKPIIGIVGGIGSGKSFVASLFAELGCLVISSDEEVHRLYQDPRVKQALREWWGDSIFDAVGEINRAEVGRKVFSNSQERKRLEGLIHPLVHEGRKRVMQAHADDAQVLVFVWDTPLLIEVGLNNECDAVVFVDAPLALRVQRLRASRGWSEEELSRREKSQMPLDKKRQISDYVISNIAGADQVRVQVREVLSRVLAG